MPTSVAATRTDTDEGGAVPDWTYHPVWRPLMFRLPAEDARRLTVGYLELQGRTRVGRELFRLLSHGIPAGDGLRLGELAFPSPFGLGPGLDVEGRGLRVSQFLGCGFLSVGPVSHRGADRVRSLDRIRVPEHHALAWSDDGYAPAAADVAEILASHAGLVKIPVGVVVTGERPAGVVRVLDEHADFFSVRASAADDDLRDVRASTARPVLLRVPSGDGALPAAERAEQLGFDGVVLGDGRPYAGLPVGRIAGRPEREDLLGATRAVVARFGDDLPVVVSGAVLTPDDAAGCLEAGARLVEITHGFVYSGPGIAARCLAAEASRPAAAVASEDETPPRRFSAPGAFAGSWAGMVAALAVLLAVVPNSWVEALSAGSVLLREDAVAERPALVATLFAIAALAAATGALARRGQAWAGWFALTAAALVAPVSPVVAGAAGLVVAAAELRTGWLRHGFRAVFDRGVPAWRWSAANLGRRALQVGGLVAAGVGLTAEGTLAVRAVTCGTGLVGVLLLQRGLLPGLRGLWFGLGAWYLAISFAGAALAAGWIRWGTIGVLALCGASGLAWLWRPLVHLDEGGTRFPDV